jgi:hypothetical protein
VMDSGGGREAYRFRDLADARGVAPLGHGLTDERQDAVRPLLVLLCHAWPSG